VLRFLTSLHLTNPLSATGRSPTSRSTAGRPRGRVSKLAAKPFNPERSFGEESNLFGRAGFDTSSVNPPSDVAEEDDSHQVQGTFDRGPKDHRAFPRPSPKQQKTPKPVSATPKPVTPKSAAVPKRTSLRGNAVRPVDESGDWWAALNRVNQQFKDGIAL
jgi:hypothetical protein